MSSTTVAEWAPSLKQVQGSRVCARTVRLPCDFCSLLQRWCLAWRAAVIRLESDSGCLLGWVSRLFFNFRYSTCIYHNCMSDGYNWLLLFLSC